MAPVGAFLLSVLNTETVFAFSGKLFRTYNCGESWDSIIVLLPQNYFASEMFFINPNKGWITTAISGMLDESMRTDYCILTTNDGDEVGHHQNLLKMAV